MIGMCEVDYMKSDPEAIFRMRTTAALKVSVVIGIIEFESFSH